MAGEGDGIVMAEEPPHDALHEPVLDYRTQWNKGLRLRDRAICALLAILCWGLCAGVGFTSISFFVHADYVLCLSCVAPMVITGYWAVYFTMRSLNAAQPRMEREIVEDD